MSSSPSYSCELVTPTRIRFKSSCKDDTCSSDQPTRNGNLPSPPPLLPAPHGRTRHPSKARRLLPMLRPSPLLRQSTKAPNAYFRDASTSPMPSLDSFAPQPTASGKDSATSPSLPLLQPSPAYLTTGSPQVQKILYTDENQDVDVLRYSPSPLPPITSIQTLMSLPKLAHLLLPPVYLPPPPPQALRERAASSTGRFTAAQTQVLRIRYLAVPFPSRAETKQLGEEMGVPERHVRLWFRRRRNADWKST